MATFTALKLELPNYFCLSVLKSDIRVPFLVKANSVIWTKFPSTNNRKIGQNIKDLCWKSQRCVIKHSNANTWEGGKRSQRWPLEEMLERQETGQRFQRVIQLKRYKHLGIRKGCKQRWTRARSQRSICIIFFYQNRADLRGWGLSPED